MLRHSFLSTNSARNATKFFQTKDAIFKTPLNQIMHHKDHSKALLLLHAKQSKWFQLGGHCDGDADVLRVAIKEAQEESGIDGIEPVSRDIFNIDIHRVPEIRSEPAHDHYDICFLLHVTSDEVGVQNHESKALLWVSKDPADLPTDNRAVVRMFNKWREMTLSDFA